MRGLLTVTPWTPVDADEYAAIEETGRSADRRLPLMPEPANPAAIMDEVLARESATCEACQETVDPGAGGDLEGERPFVIWKLVENVHTLENHVLLCVPCVNRPDHEWKADVRAKRTHERDFTPTRIDRLAHWLSDPTATSLFARRVTAALVGLLGLVVAVATAAAIGGPLVSDAGPVAWATAVLTATTGIAGELRGYPWLVGSFVGLAYAAHAVERVRYDPRGSLPCHRAAWVRLTAAGGLAGGGALGLLGVTSHMVPATPMAILLVAAVWAIGAAGVAWYIDRALRHDLAVGIWTPARLPWLVAGRIGILPGLLAITFGVPFADNLAETTTGVLAAIPVGVALTFAGIRLPHDPFARDAILELLPARVLTALQNGD